MGLVEYFEAERILRKYGIRSVSSKYVNSREEAVKFAGNENIVLKVVSGKALHKSKSGLVAAGVSGRKQIMDSYDMLSRKAAQYRPYKILAQKMVNGGVEIIIGGNVDEQFGKLVLLGLGGIYVEAFKDFALRVCPISKRDAKEMIAQLRSKNIIAKDEKQENMIIDLVLKVSKMYLESDIRELDLNPIILHDGTYDAVDLRMIR